MTTEQIKAEAEVTVTLNLQQLLHATIGEIPPYTGDPDDDFEMPTPLYGAIVQAAATQLVHDIRRDAEGYRGLSGKVREVIEERISEAIVEQLDREFKPVDSYGEVQRNADPTTLREQIGKQARDALAQGMAPSDRSGYNSGTKGAVRKYIDAEIDRQIKTELQAEVASAKALVVAKVKDAAAQAITDQITKGAN